MADKLIHVLSGGLLGRKEPREPRPIVVLRRGPQAFVRPPEQISPSQAERLGEFPLSFLH